MKTNDEWATSGLTKRLKMLDKGDRIVLHPTESGFISAPQICVYVRASWNIGLKCQAFRNGMGLVVHYTITRLT